jgi:hypothetical protein
MGGGSVGKDVMIGVVVALVAGLGLVAGVDWASAEWLLLLLLLLSVADGGGVGAAEVLRDTLRVDDDDRWWSSTGAACGREDWMRVRISRAKGAWLARGAYCGREGTVISLLVRRETSVFGWTMVSLMLKGAISYARLCSGFSFQG